MRSEVFKRILVPADKSPSSINAQQISRVFGEKFGSEITVFHVISRELMDSGLRETAAEMHKPSHLGSQSLGERQLAYKKGKKSISEAAAFFREKDIAPSIKLVEHVDPAEAIIEEAEKGNYDLVIIGQGGNEDRGPHLGSVAEKVSQHTRTPVLFARKKGFFSSILVPIDGSENAREALKCAATIAEKTDAKVTLLHVTERSPFKLRSKDSGKIGSLILSKAAEEIKGVNVHQMMESGNPAKIITEMADKRGYDLIVIGSKGQGAKIRFWLGSVSSHVIHYAPGSVLLVPTRQDKEGSVTGLSPEGKANRLVNLFVASRGAAGSYFREEIGEDRLLSMFEYESERFSKGLDKIVWRADEIAKNMIRLNFQPFGMEARYSGNSEKATIIVTKCPLPEKFVQSVEFLKEFTFEQKGAKIDEMFASIDKVSSSWEWPPKKTEVCATCRIVMPKLGKKLGFTWKHRVMKVPPECVFDIEITEHRKA
jgi:nucleotide-binding universal stress UspA family protein